MAVEASGSPHTHSPGCMKDGLPFKTQTLKLKDTWKSVLHRLELSQMTIPLLQERVGNAVFQLVTAETILLIVNHKILSPLKVKSNPEEN